MPQTAVLRAGTSANGRSRAPNGRGSSGLAPVTRSQLLTDACTTGPRIVYRRFELEADNKDDQALVEMPGSDGSLSGIAYRNRIDDLRTTVGTVPSCARARCTDSTGNGHSRRRDYPSTRSTSEVLRPRRPSTVRKRSGGTEPSARA